MVEDGTVEYDCSVVVGFGVVVSAEFEVVVVLFVIECGCCKSGSGRGVSAGGNCSRSSSF